MVFTTHVIYVFVIETDISNDIIADDSAACTIVRQHAINRNNADSLALKKHKVCK